ncbi:LCP family protein [Nocardioides sp. GY 10127]|uniref:LCP family protein n=1 Tax=Nocardioides sp. GY 10127 TaxID=2569762 RepID=UPI0010A7E178|nr:LCP family protein [Nocardioides sp. GY 10127]TIC80810.1 LytR family transcriptional regulator [Nocardioides sp. GY 10127]
MPDEDPSANDAATPGTTGDPAADAPRRGRRRHRRVRSRRLWRHPVLIALVATQMVLAIATATGVTVVYDHLNSNLDVEDVTSQLSDRPTKATETASTDSEPTTALNILVMGSDTRSCDGCAIDGEAGGGGSDTTILLHISADRTRAYGVSLPRDALVTRPDCTDSDGNTIAGGDLEMFNTAFAVGGAACTIQTVEQLTGIYIDDYVVVDFASFEDMVDAVGGVEVCIPTEVDDSEHHIHFDAGTQVLTGRQALNYVRERYVLSANSDIGRMKRQQAFIASMINQVVSAGTLTQPNKVVSFLNAATSSLTLDSGLGTVSKLAKLALTFADTGLDNIQFVTVPFEEYEPDPNRLVWAPSAKKLWKAIRQDKPLPKSLQSGAISASDPVGSTKSASSSATQSTEEQEKATTAAENGLCA